ncbi:MAG TPA: hypothetical protein VFH78_14515 [Candidatus Thermoplasmatota archaeon]|nr:hypothetical protein [Candidatus Thermoplasmatota archaeon]
MRRFLALLLVAGLLLASTGAVAEQGKGRGRGGPFQPLGAFTLEQTSQSAVGEHVSFTYSEAGIDDFRAANRTLFDISVRDAEPERLRGPDRDRGAQAHGSQLRVRMPNFTFTAHDAPTAASKLQTDGLVVVAFEPGVVLAAENGERVRFSFGEITGVLRGDEVAISGRNVTADGEVLLVLDAPRGPFPHHRDLGRAIGKGHVGAETTISLAENDSIEESVVSYANVTMRTLKAERGNITVLIDGHGTEGRVIVLNVDGRILGAEGADKLQVLIDNETVRPASNLSDILDPDDDGFYPEYYIVYDVQAQAFQLIATLPHYSVHILSVTTPFVLPPPSVVIGILAGVALLVPSALLLFRRR